MPARKQAAKKSGKRAPVKQAAKQVKSFAERGKATRFKKGQSGNPNGRPKNKSSFAACLREEIDKICPHDKQGRTWTEVIVFATLRLAMTGNSTALKEVWERIDGKVTIPLEIDTPDGQPLIKIEFVKVK